MTWVPWAEAWQAALYADHGFYRAGPGAAAHFATSVQGAPGVGELYAGAMVRLAREKGLGTVVDVGCGGGELVAGIRRLAPDLHCIGVDVTSRPDLDPAITWLTAPGGPELPDELSALTGALVVANEWLDVVPCTVAEVGDDHVLRVVLVDPASGHERLGDQLGAAELAWCHDHWPTDESGPGDRVEVGLARDLAWADLLARVDDGVAIAVDYGHVRPSRPAPGTLTGFSRGHQVSPVPDGSCDLTAHVAMDSLPHDELVTQREALRRLGVEGSLPPHDLASRDATAYLSALSRSSAAATLTAAHGLGGFWWAVRVIRRP